MKALSLLDHGPDVVPLFVYGTLREDGVLRRAWLRDTVTDTEPATCFHHRLLTYENHWFPFMVPDEGSITHGELLWVRKGSELADTIRMEENAGYTFTLVDVEVNSITGLLPALSFTWQGERIGMTPVKFGDWMAT